MLDTAAVLDLLKEVAAEVITPRFRALADHQVIEKHPGDLVTVADREAEVVLTKALLAAYPDAVVLGEEASHEDATLVERYRAAEHAFTVDPVDGTKNFVNGSPDHAVMVAEVLGGETVRAWIWQPEHEVAWVAERGAGVTRNGVAVRRTPAGAQPQGATSIWSRRGRTPADLPPLVGSWICCGVDYPHLIEGDVDYLIYGNSNPWDHAPGILMVVEAGGAACFRDGTPYSPTTQGSGLVIGADPDTLALATAGARTIWRS